MCHLAIVIYTIYANSRVELCLFCSSREVLVNKFVWILEVCGKLCDFNTLEVLLWGGCYRPFPNIMRCFKLPCRSQVPNTFLKKWLACFNFIATSCLNSNLNSASRSSLQRELPLLPTAAPSYVPTVPQVGTCDKRRLCSFCLKDAVLVNWLTLPPKHQGIRGGRKEPVVSEN